VSARVFFMTMYNMYICIFSSSNTFFAGTKTVTVTTKRTTTTRRRMQQQQQRQLRRMETQIKVGIINGGVKGRHDRVRPTTNKKKRV
jgi:uncharacterized membrane protein